MKFSNTAEAFNFYRNQSIEDMQKRAVEIGKEIDSNADADVDALNLELKGIKEAKENAETRSDARKTLSFLEGSNMTPQGKTFDRETVYSTEEYRSGFFKTLLGHKLSDVEKRAFELGIETRNDAYNTSANSAAVLPTQTLNEIIRKARTMGGLLGECRSFNMPTKISVPIGTPSTKAAWHTEAAPVGSENVTVVPVSFDGYEIMKVFSISEKVRKMSVNAFESYLIEELRDCVLETLDYTVVAGTGSSQGSGLETITWTKSGATQNAVEIAANGSFTYAKVVEFVALLKRGYAAGAKMAMNNRTLYNVFYSILDTTNRPIFIADPKDESIGKVLGFPVVIDDNIDDNVVYLGNFSKYFGYNLPEGIVIESSRESSFKKGVVDYRALCIADCKPLVTEAFVKLYKAAST